MAFRVRATARYTTSIRLPIAMPVVHTCLWWLGYQDAKDGGYVGSRSDGSSINIDSGRDSASRPIQFREDFGVRLQNEFAVMLRVRVRL